jgi:hypothetical protein
MRLVLSNPGNCNSCWESESNLAPLDCYSCRWFLVILKYLLRGVGMRIDVARRMRNGRAAMGSFLATGFLLLFVASCTQSSFAIPAFARKYGLPCSSCHESWPKLSPFGQAFKDNGYQLMNERDAPVWQQPAYWPATFRMTPIWHRESQNRTNVDGSAGPMTAEAQVTTNGFDLSGLDFHTAGTLAKNYSFYLLPSSDPTGAFHFESVWARVDNIMGSSWLNIKMGKFELDNLLSEKRILTLTNVSGVYTNYHFQPLISPGSGVNTPGAIAAAAESLYRFGIGDNQLGLEWMGHSKDDRTRISAALISSQDGTVLLPNGRSYGLNVAASQAFALGNLGLQRVGGFAYVGEQPTYMQYTQGGVGVPGTGIGNKSIYRTGLIGMWYLKKYNLTTIFFHSGDSAYLGSNTPSNTTLPTGARAPTWNGGLFESNYVANPHLVLIQRYELVRMTRQVFASNPSNLGNMDVLTYGFRYYPFLSSRAGFAFHGEYANERQIGAAPVSGLNLSTSSLLGGFDFDF